MQNEHNVWSYFIENKLLFSTEVSKTKKFIDDAPFTTAFSKDSPPRLGQFIGWKIMTEYAAKTGADIKEVMNEADSQKILSVSKYKPKK